MVAINSPSSTPIKCPLERYLARNISRLPNPYPIFHCRLKPTPINIGYNVSATGVSPVRDFVIMLLRVQVPYTALLLASEIAERVASPACPLE
jgi:hypothetical protein